MIDQAGTTNPLLQTPSLTQIPDVKRFTALQNIPEAKTIEASFRPQYESNWPEDLPSHCVLCGNEFRVSQNLQFGPSKATKQLKTACKITMTISLSAFSMIVIIVAIFGIGNPYIQTGISVIAFSACILFVASPVIFFSSLLIPDVRHLQCKKCDWSQDFSILKANLNIPN
jgi:hypothetical protein